MKKLSTIGVILTSLFISSSASALSPVVSIAQLGGAGSGTSQQEFFQIYNNSSEDVDVTNWCIVSGETTNLACFVPPSSTVKLFFESKRAILVGSSQFLAANPMVTLDYMYTTSNIPATNGTLKIIDAYSSVIDRLGWGTGTAEGSPVPGNLTGGKVYKRISSDTVSLQDTNNNAADFTVSDIPLLLSGGGIYEQEILVDTCNNIDGVQTSPPEGFVQNGINCDPIDVCQNITGPQTEIPIGFMQDIDGGCYEDVCENLAGLQKMIPNGYDDYGSECRIIELKLSELLPNAIGVDTGKEFIELYNPSDRTVSTENYSIQFGSRIFELPNGTLLSKEYHAFSDAQTGIVLTNTVGQIQLMGPDGTILDTAQYQDARDDESWARIDDVWQYTDNPSPSLANIPMTPEVIEGETVDDSTVGVCPAGKYRNPLTGRCKSYETGSELKPCEADQERNPETGRCRSLFSASSLIPCQPGQTRNPETNRCRSTVSAVSATLVPCKAGEERNPATNRCRKIATSSILKPCPAGQERNPETNRCRKSTASAVLADVKDNPTSRTSNGFGWILAGGALTTLGGYGLWEWRREIVDGFSKLTSFFGKSPPEP